MNDTDNDRREHARLPVNLPVEYKKLEDFFVDYAVDISQGGMFIATETPMEVGASVNVKFIMPGENMHFEATGKVVRATEEPDKGFGINFDPLSDEALSIIDRLWEAKMSENA